MIAAGYKMFLWLFTEWLREAAADIREIHVLRARERLQGPVDEAVEEDEAGAAGPHHQDGDEGGTQIVDHLQANR